MSNLLYHTCIGFSFCLKSEIDLKLHSISITEWSLLPNGGFILRFSSTPSSLVKTKSITLGLSDPLPLVGFITCWYKKQTLTVSMNLKSLLSSLLFVLHVVQSGSSHYSDSHYSDTHNSDSHYSDTH